MDAKPVTDKILESLPPEAPAPFWTDLDLLIVSRIRAMAESEHTPYTPEYHLKGAQAAAMLANYLSQEKAPLLQKIEVLRNRLWHAGICADCGEEIQHNMEEPLATCSCQTSEATIVPTIAQLRYEIYNLTYCNPHLHKITEHIFKDRMTAICTDPAIAADQVIGEFDRRKALTQEMGELIEQAQVRLQRLIACS